MENTETKLPHLVQECKNLYDHWQELTEDFNATGGDVDIAKEAVKAHKAYIAALEHVVFTVLPTIK